MSVHVRPAQASDAAAWVRMRQVLWPSSTDDHAREAAAFFEDRNPSTEVLIASDERGRPLGFAELSIRSHAESCVTRNVAYLEGWFVEPDVRGQGIGAALVAAAEDWGRARGCSEFGSDTNIENDTSIAAHRALGFEEVDRIVCFKKTLR